MHPNEALAEQIRSALGSANVRTIPRPGGGIIRSIDFAPRSVRFTIPAAVALSSVAPPEAPAENVEAAPTENAAPAPEALEITREAPGPHNERGRLTADRLRGIALDERSISRMIEGVASSTSVDAYGTEMSREALESMAIQCRAGTLAYLPRHNYGLFGKSVEWDEVIGRVVDARVDRAEVVAPYDPAADQYAMTIRISLGDDPMCDKLLNRIAAGDPIGQSIGGWFLSMEVHENEEGEILRAIVRDVELDHVAATRRPANPDSDRLGIAAMRSLLDGIRGLSVRANDEDVGDGAKVTTKPVRKRIEADCAVVEYEDTRVSVSFDSTASDDAILAAGRSALAGNLGPELSRVVSLLGSSGNTRASEVDDPSGAAYAPNVSDARGSATDDNHTTAAAGDQSGPQEPAMPTSEEIRAIIEGAIAPMAARLDAIEARAAAPAAAPTPVPTPAAAPAVDPLAVAEARAQEAERALAVHLRSQGRAVRGVPGGVATAGDGVRESRLVTLARQDAPTLVRTIEALTDGKLDDLALDDTGTDDARSGAANRNRFQIQREIAAAINAAVADGVVSTLDDRSALGAGWR